MLVGRNVWILDAYEGIQFCTGPLRVLSFRKFLPAGKFRRKTFEGKVEVSERKQSLVQFWTLEGGMRTATVASIWSKNPGTSSTPW